MALFLIAGSLALTYFACVGNSIHSRIGKSKPELDRLYGVGWVPYDPNFLGKHWDLAYDVTPPIAPWPTFVYVRFEQGVVVEEVYKPD